MKDLIAVAVAEISVSYFLQRVYFYEKDFKILSLIKACQISHREAFMFEK